MLKGLADKGSSYRYSNRCLVPKSGFPPGLGTVNPRHVLASIHAKSFYQFVIEITVYSTYTRYYYLEELSIRPMMKFISFTPSIACMFTHTNPYNWPVHESDLRQEAFISYWGFTAKDKANSHVAILRKQHPAITAELRPAQRLKGFKYELKIWGLPWRYVQGEIASTDPIKAAMQPGGVA